MNYDEAANLLRSPDLDRNSAFTIMDCIASMLGNEDTRNEASKLTLLCLEQIDRLPADLAEIVNSFLLELGHYPYLAQRAKNLRESLSVEFCRSRELPEIVLHLEQLKVSEALKTPGGVILSAPTSFGKSLLIEEVVASEKHRNIVIIEPTLALIDELRTKLKKYDHTYKLIFTKGQRLSERNIFLLTQERLVDYKDLPKIDFFVIDEFYKLSADSTERTSVLNHAFYLLLKHTNQYYLLGPPVDYVPSAFLKSSGCRYLGSDFETVTIEKFEKGARKFEVLGELLKSLKEPTLIYCRGAGTSETLAKDFLSLCDDFPDLNDHEAAIDWAQENIHEHWTLLKCLKRGIGFHHGSLPRHFSKYLVEAFNAGTLKYLFCTTTLIEGVNTSAKNVVIYDQRKGDFPLTKFDVKNISGRAGRMGRYLSGRVFIFGQAPQIGEMKIDFPWYTQDSASDELLIQLNAGDLTPRSRSRLKPIADNKALPIEIIRQNSNVYARGQISLAAELRRNPSKYHSDLCWSTYPESAQLYTVCNLIWDHLIPKQPGKRVNIDGVLSGNQLAFFVDRYRASKSFNAIIHKLVADGASPDKAIRDCAQQVRKWFEFRFPKLLMALNNIQKTTFESLGFAPGDFSFFAGQIENGFVPKGLSSLKELGVPQELALKLSRLIQADAQEDIDVVLKEIRRLANTDQLHPYETAVLRRL